MTSSRAIAQIIAFTMLGSSLALATQGLVQSGVRLYLDKPNAEIISYDLPDGTYCVAIK